jgi:hypothetical protein
MPRKSTISKLVKEILPLEGADRRIRLQEIKANNQTLWSAVKSELNIYRELQEANKVARESMCFGSTDYSTMLRNKIHNDPFANKILTPIDISNDELDKPTPKEAVNHPSHYGGEDSPYEVIKVLKAWGLHKNFALANTIKYIARADHKGVPIVDLEKAVWYLNWEIQDRKAELNKVDPGTTQQ